ncbi:MAG: polymerase subunit sigma-24 [Bacillota bacterium]|jgi:RNA polymerase sigma-70 factor (ECF subfamily)|nr:polymerase subunit sigma-24 [Bacillota bacterium]
MDDREILAGLKRLDETAYEALMDKYFRYVGAVVVRTAGNRLPLQDIEEICSDTFIKIWFSSGTIQLTGENLKGYIGITARNLTLNVLRGKRKTFTDNLEADMVSCRSAEDYAVLGEEMGALKEMINTLAPLDREIFIRRYFYLERVMDIAREKGLNEKTVSTKLSRARQRLQLAIDKGGI